MRTRNLYLGLAMIAAGCARHVYPQPAQLGNDQSIIFPRFYDQPAIHVGAGDKPYELDGVVLRALMIAANHFRPPSEEEQPCWARQEAQRYRVIRQGDIVFVDISEDPEFCGMDYISLDSGATYAISVDGRILRRVTGAEPARIFEGSSPDAGSQGGEQRDGGTGATSPTPSLPPPAVPDAGELRR
jgi:hypothetical protein